MGLSVTQRFLVAAAEAAGPSDDFRWDLVGTSLGFTRAIAEQAVESLAERKLVVVLNGGAALMCNTGRQFATQLVAKARGGDRRPNLRGSGPSSRKTG